MLTRSQIALILPRASASAMAYGDHYARECKRNGGTQALADRTRDHATAAEQYRQDRALAYALDSLPPRQRERAYV